ncbi:MAG: HAMP domain-containing protein [Candidatus Rokubacteria bacterium]|nr:HAMP domain-containing protein [Candidatus Rokubacteria bacterium]
MLTFRSFQSRLLVAFVGLVAAVQVVAFLLVNATTTDETLAQLRDDLLGGDRVVNRILRGRTVRLTEAVRLLSADPAFKAVADASDPRVRLAGLQRYQLRMSAYGMMLVGGDGTVTADTLHPDAGPAPFPFPRLLQAAGGTGPAAGAVAIDGRPYQVVVAQLPRPGWVVMVLAIDEALVADLGSLAQGTLSILVRTPPGGWTITASTLPAARQPALLAAWPTVPRGPDSFTLRLGGEDYVSRLVMQLRDEDFAVGAILQKSAREAAEPFLRLRTRLLLIIALGTAVSLLFGIVIARTVSRPVRRLVDGVRRIERGDYGHHVDVRQGDELGELAAAINTMRLGLTEREERLRQHIDAKTKAEAESAAKSRFLAIMSHELRTPLNAIIGFSQILLNGTYGALDGKQSEFVASILGSGRHLLHAISDLLDVSKLEAGRMTLTLTPCDPAEVIRGTVAAIEASARQKSLRVATELPADLPRVTADESKLRQILHNLLGNAVKFTAEGGRVTVAATVEEDADSRRRWVRVAIRDTGVGVPPDEHERIFIPFEQMDASAARERHGTGLGLALTRGLVELHGGRIWVESDGVPGRGSVFVFVLPLDGAPST